MEIQTLTDSDLSLIGVLQPTGWPDIMPHIEFYVNTPFCFPVKITIDKKIAGIGTSIIHHDTAWLAHIIVHPEYRNKGIGTFITKILLENVRAANIETIYLIASDLGEPVYKKLGFEVESNYLLYKDVKLSEDFPLPDNIIPANESHKQQDSHIRPASIR